MVPECQSPGGAGIRYAALSLGEAGDRPGGRQAGTEISHGGPGTRQHPLGERESSCLLDLNTLTRRLQTLVY